MDPCSYPILSVPRYTNLKSFTCLFLADTIRLSANEDLGVLGKRKEEVVDKHGEQVKDEEVKKDEKQRIDEEMNKDEEESKDEEVKKDAEQRQESKNKITVNVNELYYCTLCFREQCTFRYTLINTCSPTFMTGLQWNRNLCAWESQMDCMIAIYHNLTEEGKLHHLTIYLLAQFL